MLNNNLDLPAHQVYCNDETMKRSSNGETSGTPLINFLLFDIGCQLKHNSFAKSENIHKIHYFENNYTNQLPNPLNNIHYYETINKSGFKIN